MKANEITEGVGVITKQNQTQDVGPNQTKIEAAKMGFRSQWRWANSIKSIQTKIKGKNMARLNAKEVTIKVSKLQKDNEDDIELLTSETIAQLESIIAELVGEGVIVEIESNS